MKCIVCRTNEVSGRNNFCDECFRTKIEILDRKYGIKKGPSVPVKESREAPSRRTLTENTHR